MQKNETLEVLKNKNFVLIWVAGIISILGNWIYYVAISALLFDLTNSGAGIVKLKSSQTVALLLLTPIVGVIVDRVNRKKLMIFADGSRAVVLILLVLFRGNIIIYFVGVFITIMSVVAGSADNALMPDIVKKEYLVTANSILETTNNIMLICGGALGGIIVATGGYNLAFIIDIITFVISVILLSLVTGDFSIEREKISSQQEGLVGNIARVFRMLRDDLMYCLKYIWSEKYIVAIIVMFILLSFGAGAINVLTLVYANKVLLVGSKGYGFLLTLQGLGSLLASMSMVFLNHKFKPVVLFNGGFLLMGLSMTSLGLTQNFGLAGLLFFISGFGNILFLVPSVSVMQKVIPSDVRGRVFSFQNVAANTALLLGMLITGLVENLIDIRWIISTGGMFETLGALFSIIVFIKLTRQQRDLQVAEVAT